MRHGKNSLYNPFRFPPIFCWLCQRGFVHLPFITQDFKLFQLFFLVLIVLSTKVRENLVDEALFLYISHQCF